MFDRIIHFSIKNRFLVFILTAVLAGFGLDALRRLPIDAVPDITNVQIQVLTKAPSLGPVDVERTITFPVESSMSGLPELEQIRSVSRFGLSAVTLVFEEGTDLLRARQLVSERLVQARERLPPDASPELGPMSTGLGEIFLAGVPVIAVAVVDVDEGHYLTLRAAIGKLTTLVAGSVTAWPSVSMTGANLGSVFARQRRSITIRSMPSASRAAPTCWARAEPIWYMRQ